MEEDHESVSWNISHLDIFRYTYHISLILFIDFLK